MVLKDDDMESKSYCEWLKETEERHISQKKNIQLLENAERLDESKLRSLDSTLKKVTAFMKKLKQISNSQSIISLFPELEKLNLSKYLDEFATSVCEAKVKISETNSIVDLCVKMSCLYSNFPELLLNEFKKNVPFKKTDKINNASKLRVDIKLLSELVVNGVLKKEGLKFLGGVLAYVMNTDKSEHVNVSILLPLCKTMLFDLSGLVPMKIKRLSTESNKEIPNDLSSSLLTSDNKQTIAKLFSEYYTSLIHHLNETRLDMNKIHKSIKRQERTRGDASAEDRLKFESVKQVFDRLLQNASDLSAYIGEIVPPMPEEPSEDEEEMVVKKIKEERVSIWPHPDTQNFYENLVNINLVVKSADSLELPDEAGPIISDENFETNVADSIDAIDMSELEVQPSQIDEMNEQENLEDDMSETEEETRNLDGDTGIFEMSTSPPKETPEQKLELEAPSKEHISMSQFLERLTNAINRELIDKCAIDFVADLNRKGTRKRLIQHILSVPTNRLDLLPFLGRFLATIQPVVPEVPQRIAHELLTKFRAIAEKKYQPPKKGAAKSDNVRIDTKVHLSSFIAELVKFSILPKAEAIACLRTLLVDLKSYKVDMLSVMVESMGLFLYRSPESHAKMSIILQVIREKNQKMIKDPRQQILLDNAYFAVIPPEEASASLERRPPMEEFIQMKISTTPGRGNILRRIDWSNENVSEVTLKILSNPTSVRFSDLEKLASLVGLLSDYHDWIGIHVVDSVVEFIRFALESANPSFQQRLFSSIKYIGELYNYNMCGSAIIFKVLYQLITFSINESETPEELSRCILRIRLVCEMINTVGEFFMGGSYRKKLDTFLHFFLRFFYDTKSKWSIEIVEELGDFPQDLTYLIDELLNRWRKDDTFAKNLDEALQRINDIEKEYKTKVEEVLQGIRVEHEEEIDDQRRLNCIMEDEEDEPEEEVRKHLHNGSLEESSQQLDEVEDLEEEHIRVHKDRNIMPEDEDFMKDFERLMNETIQLAPINLKTPLNDLEVPPSVRQKFERKIVFESDFQKPGSSEGFSLKQSNEFQKISPAPKIALMARGKKGTVLKAVHVETSESMEKNWQIERIKRERERNEVKQLTLDMNERMRTGEDEDVDLGDTSKWPTLSGNE